MNADGPLRRRLARAAPIALRRLTGLGPILVLAPHPDDEAFGCGGLIAAARAIGIDVRVAFVTDGAASHLGSRLWPPARVAQRRKLEAIRAGRALGLKPRNLVFLDLPDGEAAFDLARLDAHAYSLARWARAVGASALFATWAGESHPDHIATAELARTIAQTARRLAAHAYPIWGLADPDVRAPRRSPIRRLDVRGLRHAKTRAIAAHRSQVTRMIADAESPRPPAPDRRLFLTGWEAFFMSPRSRLERNGR